MTDSPFPAVQRRRGRVLAAVLTGITLVAAACGGDDDATSATDTTSGDATATETTADHTHEGDDADHTHDDDESTDSDDDESTDGLDVSLFFDGALAEDATIEPCTLSDGTETMCYRLTVAGDPVTYDTGPFCVKSIDATADDGGVWFDGNAVYDIDGEFITGLAELYGDDNWLLYDDDGNVNVTETAEEFDLAARPDVDPSVQNHCVEGQLDWLPDGQPVTTTMLIPVEPVLADAPASTSGNLGVTLDGVVIAQSAPVDAILGAYTIAAFDDCGGHYNPIDGYHLHGALGCSELDEVADGETPMFAYAADGFPVHSPLDDPDSVELDECNGHTTDEAGYHYHANSAEQNLVIECLIGVTVAGEAGGGPGGGRGGPPPGDG